MTTIQWCDANGILPVHYAAVQLVLSHLTILELCSQYTALTAGFDPRKVNGYGKIESLYRKDQGGALIFRSDDREIFQRVLGFRLDQEEQP